MKDVCLCDSKESCKILQDRRQRIWDSLVFNANLGDLNAMQGRNDLDGTAWTGFGADMAEIMGRLAEIDRKLARKIGCKIQDKL